jgi:hypothetical protein
MVKDDYKEFKKFSMTVVKERSKYIEKLMNSDLFYFDVNKIGMLTYWQTEVTPILNRLKGWEEVINS